MPRRRAGVVTAWQAGLMRQKVTKKACEHLKGSLRSRQEIVQVIAAAARGKEVRWLRFVEVDLHGFSVDAALDVVESIISTFARVGPGKTRFGGAL